MRIDNQTGDFIVFVGNDGLMQELFQGHVGQRDPRRDHLLRAIGCDPCQAVAGARRRGPGPEIARVFEYVAGSINRMAIDHGGSGPSALVPATAVTKTISWKDSTQPARWRGT